MTVEFKRVPHYERQIARFMSYYYTFGEKREKLLQDLAWLDHVMNERKAILGDLKVEGKEARESFQQRCFLEHENSVDKRKCTEMSQEIAKLTLKIKNASSEIQRFTDLCKK